MPSVLKPSHFAATTLALSLAAAGQAYAAGFALMEQNASGLGNAYAGQAAAAEDASTIFFNPAGMTYLKGRQVVGTLNLIDPYGKFNDKGSTPPTAQNGGGDGGDNGDLAAIPAAYLSWQLSNQLWLGIGVGAPFGLKTEYEDDWIGRFRAIKSEVKTININPSIAWKVNDALSIGGGVNAQRIEADLTNQQSYVGFGADEGRATVKGDDWGWGWNLGVIFQLSDATRLGASYRSKVKYTLEGDVRFGNPPAAFNALQPPGDIKADIDLPDSFSVALSHQITPRLQLLADYTWTGWDSIQDLVIQRDPRRATPLTVLELKFEDAWRAGVGLNYQLNDAWKLRGGLALDKTPVRDQYRTPRLPDGDRVWAAIGAQWQVSKQMALDFGYAYIWIDDPEVNLANNSTDPAPLQKGRLVGDYDAHVQIFGVQAKYSF